MGGLAIDPITLTPGTRKPRRPQPVTGMLLEPKVTYSAAFPLEIPPSFEAVGKIDV